MDTNISILTGNLNCAPEAKDLGDDKKVAEFALATHGFNEEVSFFSVKCFNKLADLCCRYLNKGSRVLIQGRFRQERWESEGKKHSKVVLVADSIQFITKKEGKELETEIETLKSENEILRNKLFAIKQAAE